MIPLPFLARKSSKSWFRGVVKKEIKEKKQLHVMTEEEKEKPNELGILLSIGCYYFTCKN